MNRVTDPLPRDAPDLIRPYAIADTAGPLVFRAEALDGNPLLVRPATDDEVLEFVQKALVNSVNPRDLDNGQMASFGPLLIYQPIDPQYQAALDDAYFNNVEDAQMLLPSGTIAIIRNDNSYEAVHR